MEHADKLVDRIIFLDGFPNMQVLDPLHIGQNVKEILDCDLKAEISARTLYEEAATHCHGARDYVTRDLFEKLMKDEEHHIDFLESSSTSSPSSASSSIRSTTSARSKTPSDCRAILVNNNLTPANSSNSRAGLFFSRGTHSLTITVKK